MSRTGDGWRTIEMDDASTTIRVLPLASLPGHSTMLVDFPPGLERMMPGGYECQEDFIVIDGEVYASEQLRSAGDLTIIPAGFERTGLRTPRGCLVLAWFTGRVSWQRTASMQTRTDSPMLTTSLTDPVPSADWTLQTPGATWSTLATDGADAIDIEHRSWTYGAARERGALLSSQVVYRRPHLAVPAG